MPGPKKKPLIQQKKPNNLPKTDKEALERFKENVKKAFNKK